MDNALKILGVFWSVVSFVAIVAFAANGQWTKWTEIRDAHEKNNVINVAQTVTPIAPIRLDGDGKTVEGNTVDKTYYSSDSCKPGEIKSATVFAGTAGPQVAICTCGDRNLGNDGTETHKGWYCFE